MISMGLIIVFIILIALVVLRVMTVDIKGLNECPSENFEDEVWDDLKFKGGRDTKR